MKQFIKYLMLFAFLGFVSCSESEDLDNDTIYEVASLATKALGDKSPMTSVYVETNDVNPLNAGDYFLADGTTFFDIVELFAANITKEETLAGTRPILMLNDKLTNILENGGVDKYVRPLQELGIKVHLTVIGHWGHIGLANMNSVQTTQFAEILAYVVEKYGLDGIGLNDEYADYPTSGYGGVNNTSFSEIIIKLHNLLPAGKMITVYDWGYTNTINSEAADCIDYAYHGYYGSYLTSSNIIGMTKERWSPMSYNLGNYNSPNVLENHAIRACNSGYGAIMFFNLRTRDDVDPLPMFQAISDGAYGGTEVVCDNGNRPRDVELVDEWYKITYDMAIQNE